MKHPALFQVKNIKCRLLQFLFGALRVKRIKKRNRKRMTGASENSFKGTISSVVNNFVLFAD